MDDPDEILGCLACTGPIVLMHYTRADVILDDLGNEPVQRTAAGRSLLQQRRRAHVFLEGPLDCFDLAANSPQPPLQFHFFRV